MENLVAFYQEGKQVEWGAGEGKVICVFNLSRKLMTHCVLFEILINQFNAESSFADTKEGRYNPRMDPVIPVHNWRKGSQVNV